jgi:hypothetical protein
MPQVLIVVLGVTAAWLVGSKDRRARFAAGVLGLCAQPVWAWSFISHEQYLMLVLCVLYGAGWVRCIRNNLSDKERHA